MPASCKELRSAVVECLRASDCVRDGNAPGDCIRMPLKDTLPTQCQQLLHAYGECKLSFFYSSLLIVAWIAAISWDRFRDWMRRGANGGEMVGNNPVGTGQELSSTPQENVPQLYGGRPALPPMPGSSEKDDEKKK
ncbi:hypothetical protein AA313_de0206861 [Arthrobotrys entomopaga]|nr:hypothetical protein AA313_de0206861 [Arthrobotrys entomopaga]